MKRIRVCEEAEARRLYNEGLFFPFVKESIPECPDSKIAIVKDVKAKTGCGLEAAVRYFDTLHDAEILYQYSDKGAISANGRLFRKIGDVWVRKGYFNDSLTYEDIFGDLPVTDVPELKSIMYGKDTKKAAVELARRLYKNDIYNGSYIRISDDEIWQKNIDNHPYMTLSIFRPDSLNSKSIRYDSEWHGIVLAYTRRHQYLDRLEEYLEKRRKERRASFGEF